jgi:hypothetical protein
VCGRPAQQFRSLSCPFRMPPSGSAADDGIASSARLGRHRWASDATDDGPDAVRVRPPASESSISGEARLPVIADTDRAADGIVAIRGALRWSSQASEAIRWRSTGR